MKMGLSGHSLEKPHSSPERGSSNSLRQERDEASAGWGKVCGPALRLGSLSKLSLRKGSPGLPTEGPTATAGLGLHCLP